VKDPYQDYQEECGKKQEDVKRTCDVPSSCEQLGTKLIKQDIDQIKLRLMELMDARDRLRRSTSEKDENEKSARKKEEENKTKQSKKFKSV
jgi:hypothetical protein